MSNYSIERRLKIGNLNKNKIFSKETIEKMRASALTRKKPSYSEQAILNMKKNSKSLIIYNLNYTVYGEYPSITEASKSLNCNDKTIRTFAFDCKSKGGFKNWKEIIKKTLNS